MFKTVLVVCVFSLWSSWAMATMDAIDEAKCIAHSKNEIGGYIMLEGWQKLFPRHYKFTVTEDGDLIARSKRLKLNTIIHNSIYGCSHEEDDDADYCPNVNLGHFKSCKHGKNLKAAMFRSARCAYVDISIKHLVLADYLMLKFPIDDQLENANNLVDGSIMPLGGSVMDMLAMLLYGEVGGIGELMSLHLYLNNSYETVLLYKVPADFVKNETDFVNARTRMTMVHGQILGRLHDFWGTWCDSNDPLVDYRQKYTDLDFQAVQQEMESNVVQADQLVRGLGVKDSRTDLNFEPSRLVFKELVETISWRGAIPNEMMLNLGVNAFEATFEFDPRALRQYHKSVLQTIYTCFYWSAITHLKLGLRIIDESEKPDVGYNSMHFLVNFAQYMRPLMAYDQDMSQAIVGLHQRVSRNLTGLFYFLFTLYHDTRFDMSVLTSDETKSRIQEILNALIADMKHLLGSEMQYVDTDSLSYIEALNLMRSNYRSFTKLVTTSSGFKASRENLIKMEPCFFYSSDDIEITQF
ncbi:uncharacterized protein LOC126834832 [Adelges cooleyi]|uniref:uncharacterized protein LOC126834832 n=1 Tax=Adelges cooleyi TaxID=133065 RepID=UPI0021800A09|nr:uncharacterized protein LOC126834832 [Adelges cooleyi]XP_050422981.1 uncharacterized protein LOC126834832 [Adelges cooleyi]